jgi:hypothetical protein
MENQKIVPSKILPATSLVASPHHLTIKQPSLRSLFVTKHGLTSNILVFLELHDQCKISNTCRRAYEIIVPWNRLPVLLPFDSPCDFPNLKIPSDKHVCMRMEATIEGDTGEFFGIVCKQSKLPDGFGVFKTNGWVHCGKFKNGFLQSGRNVSVNAGEKLLKLNNFKRLSDGSFLEKIELFSEQGVEKVF